MRKKFQKTFISFVLAVAMVVTLVIPLLPAVEARAEGTTIETTVSNAETADTWEITSTNGEGGKTVIGGVPWLAFESGSGNGNGHPNQTSPAAFIFSKDVKVPKEGGTIEADINIPNDMTNTRTGMFISYIDNNNWAFVGLDNSSEWFFQYLVDGTESYPKLSNLTKPSQGDTVHLKTEWNGSQVTVSVDDESQTLTIDALAALAAKGESQVGFRAGAWGGAYTKILFKDVKVNETTIPNDADQWSFLNEAAGQKLEAASLGGEDYIYLKSTSQNDNGNNAAVLENTSVADFSNGTIEATVKSEDPSTDRFALCLRYNDPNTWVCVGYNTTGWYCEYKINGSGEWTDPIAAAPAANQEVKVKATLQDSDLTVWLDDEQVYSGTLDGMDGVPAGSIALKGGSWGTEVTDVYAKDITYTVRTQSAPIEFEGSDTIKSDVMEVSIDDEFPRVVGYKMIGGENDGKQMYGQTEKLDTVIVNKTNHNDNTGIAIKPEVKYEKTAENKAVYTMTLKDEENNIDAVVTAELVVKDNTLEFNITDIKNNTPLSVKTIDIPNHNLVSVRSDQVTSTFAGSQMSTNTTSRGDTYKNVDRNITTGKAGYMYAFVSADGLSAGLWSNSEANVTADWQRVVARTETYGDEKQVSLSSNYWIYQKGEGYREENTATEMPSVKVAITGDENGDNVVDWQDGAIAYRDIMNNPVGAELVPDRVAIRVAMNFGSQAQNPFLMTLDNVKKVYLNTDGLGQSVLLKGYGSEGHDSGHLNYADIGTRIGGAEDMKYLLKAGKQWGATFGIHVNASETYPESIYFTEDRLRKNADGSLNYGWNWLDQGVNIDADYDLRNGREQRFVDLYNVLGGADNDLDFIYVDVWGNGQSGDNGTWASRQLAKEITLTCGWRLAGEWGYANEYDSTFQHWAADLTYGGYTLKGINSDIARFIRNHQKDSWVGDYPSYGGAAVNPLLGGYDMKDFEGWQGRNDYEGYIENLFDDDLATKFVQHYLVMQWVYGEPTTVNGISWTPEMKVVLQDEERENTLVIERQSNDGSSAGYKLRTMTFNGVKIMDGEKYLIPWFWDANGNELSSDEQKLYHWNQAGGTSTWTLPEGWSNAVVYELTENGKVPVDVASISGGQITINAKASTPYVLHKAPVSELTNEDMNWSEGVHIIDTGFNSASLDQWDITGETEAAQIVKSAASNAMLCLDNTEEEVALTQELTDLTPGQQYAAYVGVDNRSDAKAYIEVSVNGETISNYTERSIAKNYIKAYAHNTNNATTAGTGSYFQNMYVYFTAPESGNVTLTLRREAGEGATYYDDIRVCDSNVSYYDESGDVFTQDFENVVQGIYPFVIGGVEGVEDNRTHLAEKHDPYTQAGWYGVKQLDDVIEGNWSLKVNGLVQGNSLVYQTIPQNFRFEAGVTYNVKFDYESGSDGTYALAIGNNSTIEEIIPLPASIGEPSTYQFRLTGNENGQSWIGIYSTSTAADLQGTIGSTADFSGYKDIVLDNLVIEKSAAQKAELEKLVVANSNRYEVNYSARTWRVFTKALEDANAALEDFNATQETVDAAKEALQEAIDGLDVIGCTLSGKVTDSSGRAISGITVRVTKDNKELSAVTASNGTYVIPGVTFGTWNAVAENDYYTAVEAEITASKDELEITQNFELGEGLAILSGKITAVGKSVEGATVKITSGNVTEETTTDVVGYYYFENIPARVYTIQVSKDGYDVASATVEAVKEDSTIKNIMLQPLSTVDYSNDYSANETTWDNLAGNTSSTTRKFENGEVQISFPGGGHANVYETLAPEFKNGVVEMDITSSVTGTRIGILLRAKDMNNRVYVGVGDSENTYFTEYWGGADGNTWTAMSEGEAFSAGKPMHLKAEIVDKTITLWVNDVQVLKNTMPNMPTESGVIGLNCRAAKTVTVDNIKVTSYDPPAGDVTTVAGAVTDAGEAVEGAKVELLDADGNVLKTASTDALGNYKFKNISEGNYTVRVTSNGEKLEKEIQVTIGDDYFVVPETKFNPISEEVDKTVLQGLVEALDQWAQDYEITGEEFTADTWEVYEEALTSAKAVLEDPDALTEDVTLAEVRLMDALQQLVERPSKDALQAVVDAASEREEADYTAETWAVFAQALEDANAVLEDPDATREEIVAAANALVDAAGGLEEVQEVEKPSKDALIAAVNEAASLNEKDYTEETWEAYQAEVNAAKIVIADEDATAEEIAEALSALNTAKDNLKLVTPVDPEKPSKAALQAAVDAAAELNEEDYTAETWEAYQAKVDAAKAVLADEDATAEQIETALTDLNEARVNLKAVTPVTPEKPSKDDLQAAVDAAASLKEKDYTAETWKAYQDKVEAAKAVLADENATEEQIKAALTELNAARGSLKLVPTEKPGKPSGNTGLTDNKGNIVKNATTAKNSKTGDNSPILPLVICIIAAGAFLAAALKRRQRNFR